MANEDDTRRTASPVIRETPCKTVLNRSKVGDYSLNCYVGCTHACAYCYARFMQRFREHPEPWGAFVDVKTNAVEALERQLRRAQPGRSGGARAADHVFTSSACDGWQPIEAEWRLTRECCRLLLEHGFHVDALTKSALVLRDLDLFQGHAGQIGVTLTTTDERLAALWEPGASSVEDRIRVLREARNAGIPTTVMFGPLLPFLSDGPEALEALFERAADLEVDKIWVDAMNPRSKVWESVTTLLHREFPGLHERYRRILFSPPVREAYLVALRRRVYVAADHYRVADRVSSF